MKRLAIIFLLASTPAAAYVRTRTSTGTPLAWRDACGALAFAGPENPAYPTARLRDAIGATIDTWQTAIGCAPLHLSIASETSSTVDVAYDGESVVFWRLPGTCDDPANANLEVCVSPNAAAVTTVFFVDRPGDARDGELLEVDIELNAVNFEFGDDDPTRMDMRNTLSHELGHVMGLDHTCYTTRGAVPPIDDRNDRVPFCYPLGELPAGVTEATMFNFAAPGETKKRGPGADESRAMCELYATRPGTCSVPSPEGCGCRGSRGSSWIPLAVFAIYLLLSRKENR